MPSTDAETDTKFLLKQDGVDGLAPGERIWSVRYDADRAYIVWPLEQIDPLWVIDASTHPTQLFSVNSRFQASRDLHPSTKDHLLTIGLGLANADGTGLDWSATQLSLFDIEDPTDPTQSATFDCHRSNPNNATRSWSWSEASYESKAFQYGTSQCSPYRSQPTDTPKPVRTDTLDGPTSTHPNSCWSRSTL